MCCNRTEKIFSSLLPLLGRPSDRVVYLPSKMKFNLIIVIFASIVIKQIYSIIPKNRSNLAVISKLRSPDDDTRQSKHLDTPELPTEDDNKKNRLPEVNLKNVVNSKELPNDESVEDFVDMSFEQTNSDEDGKIFPSVYENNKYKQKKRRKRLAAYDGRYKYQDLNDVLESITNNEFQVKKLDNNIKTRHGRNSNIIEEENLVTTISIFKFTGRPNRLNEHSAYKNIHP